MGAKPSSVPRWADVGGAIVVPSSGKLDVGWVAAERPPAQYLNWYQNLVYLWVVWISSYFTNGGLATGATDIGHVAEATNTPMSVWRDYAQKIRATVDHNGYRMGQVSEIEEHWTASNIPGVNVDGVSFVRIPLTAAAIVAGAPTLNAFGQVKFTAASQTVQIPFDGFVPRFALITAITVRYIRTTAGDSFTIQLAVNNTVTGGGDAFNGASPALTTTVSSGTGAGSVNLLAGPFGPPAFNNIVANSNGQLLLSIATTAVTTADWITGVEVTYIMPPVGWLLNNVTATGAANMGEIGYSAPDTNMNHRSMRLLAGTVGGTQSIELLGPYETFHDANCSYVMEFMIRTEAVSATNRLVAAGIRYTTASRFVYLYNENSVANWQLRVVGSATADTDTGVAVAANTTYRVRLEIYGSAANSSGNTKIRLFINGVEVAEVNTTTLPTAEAIGPYIKAGTTAGSATSTFAFRVGRMRRVWNHLLTSDNL